MAFKLPVLHVKKITRNLYLHFFVLGMLVCLLMWFKTESAYETELFDHIHEKMLQTLPPNPGKDSFAIAALHMTHYLQERRNLVFGNETFKSVKFNYIHPATVDLMTGNGSCGSYTLVLARILKTYDMQVRFGQMTVKGKPAGHIFIETLTESGWIVLDAFYDIAFIKPNGHLAGYDDLHKNWDYYKQQVPAQYDTAYRYEAVSYTNWNKFSFLSRGVKKILDMILGKENADKISLHSYFLRIYNKLSWVVSLLLLIAAFRTYLVYRKQRNLG